MKRENVGKVLVGSGVALTLLVLLVRGGKAAPAPPPGGLFEAYMNELTAATTRVELEAIRWRFEADYSAGILTRAQYDALYNYYVFRVYSLP